mgnify:CR=1 FL=1
MSVKKSEIQAQPKRISTQLSEPEVKELVERWLEIFGKDRQGANTKAYLWHVFSSDRYPSVSGTAALNEYRFQKACEYIVLSNDRDDAFTTEVLPEKCSFSDFYVFPPNLAWTMAFTHEDGWLGPYFARHPDYVRLNQGNLARLQKAQEAAAARAKGWG